MRQPVSQKTCGLIIVGTFPFQYLKDLKSRGAKIIIGEFFESAARTIMCEAYAQGMTQKQGYVWFLPGWFRHDWYDTDALRRANETHVPNCTTAEMIGAIEGHLSLIHSTLGKDDDVMQTGQTVAAWKSQLRESLQEKNFAHDHINKYSGYVYDAVWLYALSLDRLIKRNRSYIQDIHSIRSINQFVNIINTTDFVGVTGRINFANGSHSRNSDIKVHSKCA